MSGSGTGIVTPYNSHRGMEFNGFVDCYTRGADLVGNADGRLGTISGWFRIDAGDGMWRVILGANANRVLVLMQNNNTFRVNMVSGGGANVVDFITAGVYLADPTVWHHFMASWDTAVPTGTLWIDGAQPVLGTNVVNNNVIDYTRPSWGFAATDVPNLIWNGALSECYFNFAEYLDLTVAANRERLRHPNGQPSNVWADGSFPTGTQPIMYMVEEGGVIVNRGSGGAFAAAGAPVLSADSPKDRWVASLNRGSRKRRVYAAGG